MEPGDGPQLGDELDLDRPLAAPRPLRETKVGRGVWRGGVTIVGLALIGGGVILLVIPGPGIAVILLGLAVLATEYTWARRLLRRLRERFRTVVGRVRRGQQSERDQPPDDRAA